MKSTVTFRSIGVDQIVDKFHASELNEFLGAEYPMLHPEFDHFIFVFDIFPLSDSLYSEGKEKLTISRKQRTVFCNVKCSTESFIQAVESKEELPFLKGLIRMGILRENGKLDKLGLLTDI